MTHPLVEQLRFARSELRRGLEGVTDEEARQRILPMNCIAWNVGHLAWQEQRYWLQRAQDQMPRPDVNEGFASGGPASTPLLSEVWEAWREITEAADPWLDTATTQTLESNVMIGGKPSRYIFGSLLQRTIYHYWYHIGENAAIRQNLGHTALPTSSATSTAKRRTARKWQVRAALPSAIQAGEAPRTRLRTLLFFA